MIEDATIQFTTTRNGDGVVVTGLAPINIESFKIGAVKDLIEQKGFKVTQSEIVGYEAIRFLYQVQSSRTEWINGRGIGEMRQEIKEKFIRDVDQFNRAIQLDELNPGSPVKEKIEFS